MVYHYTTLNTLKSLFTKGDSLEITEEKSPVEINLLFHATGAPFLNDAMEGQLLPIVFKDLGIPLKDLYYIERIAGLPYILSLSNDADNLTLWRNYADNGHGVALGFDEATINKKLKSSETCYIGKCSYVSFDELEDRIKENPLYNNYIEEPTNLSYLLSLYSSSLKYKHIGFINEDEFRVVISQHADECFKTIKHAIASYQIIRIPFTALRSIIVGPCLDYEKTKFSIMRMMYHYLYNWTNHWQFVESCIYKSSIPYISEI